MSLKVFLIMFISVIANIMAVMPLIN